MSPNCRILPRKNYMESSLLRYVHASNDTIRKKGKFVRGTKSQSSASIYILLTQFGALVFLLCKDKEHKYFCKALKIYHYDITYGIWSVNTKNAMFIFQILKIWWLLLVWYKPPKQWRTVWTAMMDTIIADVRGRYRMHWRATSHL